MARPAAGGDVLVFLPGEREIREAAEHLRKHHPPGVEILPLFARLSQQEQERVFEPHSARRIVLATNVAETSLTVPGIRYVIDAGLARVKRYSYRSKVEQLQIEPISQAAANQRAGRCGRVADGICIRLYDEEDFAARPRFTDPEILRSSLAGVILRMKALRLGAVEEFPFLEPPPRNARSPTATQLLGELGAVDERNELTPIGRELARLPLDPRVGRMILEAREREALREVLVIASALSVQDVRDRPLEQQQAADAEAQAVRRREVGVPRLPEAVEVARARRAAAARRAPACRAASTEQLLREHFIIPRRVREWRDIHSQLHTVVAEHGWRLNATPADLRAAAPGAARRPARQRRPEERRGRLVPRRARHQVLAPSGRAPEQEAGALDRGGRAGRDDAAVRPRHRGDRAAVAAGSSPATC